MDEAGLPVSLLDQRLEIETPERVVIVQDLAGIGSRFAAGLVDACILLVPWIFVSCAFAFAAPHSGQVNQEEMQSLGMAVVGICYAILWLYYLLFESLWGGRTPGKRMLKLRVMSVHGGPAPVSAIVLRNLLRIVDSMPTLILPAVGGVTMFVTRRAQRIGDLAAGTVVVRERQESLRVPTARSAASADPANEVSAADLEEIDRFIVRRSELLPDVRTRIAARLCERMRAAYGLPPGAPETVLGLLGARRTPAQIRDLAGPGLGAPPAPVAIDPAPPAPAPAPAVADAEPPPEAPR